MAQDLQSASLRYRGCTGREIVRNREIVKSFEIVPVCRGRKVRCRRHRVDIAVRLDISDFVRSNSANLRIQVSSCNVIVPMLALILVITGSSKSPKSSDFQFQTARFRLCQNVL